jgi:hypothetical protein
MRSWLAADSASRSVGTPIPFIEGYSGYKMIKGTDQNTFANTFLISTNLGGPLFYSNNYIREGKQYFGANSVYFTSIEGFKSFLLGAEIESGITSLKIEIALAGTTCEARST